ncbi:MAG: SDR family NAD(P)-dependent oxidoreductase [Rhizomicrobium sp.]
MQGKTVVITGATSGIGEVTAIELAKLGARIVFTARDRLRGEKTLTRLKAANPGVAHSMHLADLSALAGMKKAAAEISGAAPKVDVLINNAGAMFANRQNTADGLEATFATNHLAYYVLSLLLLPNLRAAGAGRIVCTASAAHVHAKLNFANLQSHKGYSGYPVYSRSKLCNILFTRALSRRLAGSGITVNCLHPGFVATRFADAAEGMLGASFAIAKKVGAISAEEGAKTLTYLASSPKVAGKSGLYFIKCMPATPSPEALKDEDGEKLWIASAQLSGVDLT